MNQISDIQLTSIKPITDALINLDLMNELNGKLNYKVI